MHIRNPTANAGTVELTSRLPKGAGHLPVGFPDA